jgi:4-hydroxy-tetrahydrodipicolinate reductase
MNIAIIGYGKMGKLIETLALEDGHRIGAVVDPLYSPVTSACGAAVYKTIPDMAAPDSIDVALEFTRPGTALDNIKALAERRIPAVVGTTGWQDKLAEAGAAVEAAGSALLWAPNFSLGVNLFYRIAAFSAALMDSFPGYDAAGYEIHHNKKADSPSGTAKSLAEIIIKNMGRKTQAVYETLNRPPRPEELHYVSLRLGAAPGAHTIIFDSSADSIEITHCARNREALVRGALLAARWLLRRDDDAGPPRRGVFTFDDVLAGILDQRSSSAI